MTAINLEEELAIQEGGWRTRAITFGVLLLLGAFALAAVYYFFLRDEAETVRATEDHTVVKGTINSNLLITGTADAQLNSDLTFQSAGKVGAVNVKVGDVVRQGQVLASLQSDDLANGVETAQANQRAAQLKVDDLLDGSSRAELATADQALATARATLTKAENDYNDLLDGPDAIDITAGEQAVRLAESQLAAATSTLAKLEDTPSDSEVAAAESGVAAAQSALTAAENSADSAENTVESSEASLLSAETAYCVDDGTPSFCPSGSAPVSSGDLSILNAALGSGDATLASKASAAIGANNLYLSAQNSSDSADAAVTAAEDALDSAEARLDLVEEGPTAEEMDAAQAGLVSAQAAVDSAEAKLADVNDGASPDELANSLALRNSARVAVDAAEERFAEAQRGPESNAISQAQQAVVSAGLAVEAAQIRLRNAQIIAPFDGTIASVNISPGEFASAAGTTAPIVMLTPDALILTLDIEETDYPNVKIDQGGVALFDGIPGAVYPFRIAQIGLSPTTSSGVITYEATAVLTVLPNSPRPAPGMNANGQLTTASKADIVVIPPRALRRRGSEQVVDVRKDGLIVETVVTTGVSDNSNVEILTGLAEGDVIVLPVVAGGDGGPAGAPTAVPTIPGGIR